MCVEREEDWERGRREREWRGIVGASDYRREEKMSEREREEEGEKRILREGRGKSRRNREWASDVVLGSVREGYTEGRRRRKKEERGKWIVRDTGK